MKYNSFGHKQVEFRSDISKNNNMAALDERETQSEKNLGSTGFVVTLQRSGAGSQDVVALPRLGIDLKLV